MLTEIFWLLVGLIIGLLAFGTTVLIRNRQQQAMSRVGKNRVAQALWGANVGIWEWHLHSSKIIQLWAVSDADNAEPRLQQFSAWTEIVHPADMPTTKAAFDAYLRGETDILSHELRIRTPESDWRHVLCRGRVSRRNRRRQALQMAGTFTDISDRKAAEAELRYHALLLENVSHAIISTDFEWNVLSWNSAAADMYGFSDIEMIGNNLNSLLRPEFPQVSKEDLWQEFREKGRWRGELVHHHKQGHWLRIFCTLTFALDENDVPKGIVMVNRDISDRFRDQERLESLTEALQKANNKLEQQNNTLQDKNDELTQFALKASHDLKQPLRTIHGFVEALKKDGQNSLSEEAHEYIDIISRNSRRMQSLISDLLQYARLGTDGLVYDDVDLNIITGLAKMQLAGIIQRHNVNIEIADLPVVRGHQSLLVQVFQNLINNSIIHGQQRELTIRIHARETEGGPATVSFSDNGKGIPADIQPNIFKAFERGTTWDQTPGHGLGLAICRKIMNLHGGEVALASSNESGTSFELKFPIMHAAI